MKRSPLLLVLLLASCDHKTDHKSNSAQATPAPESPVAAATAASTPKSVDPNDPTEVRRRFVETVEATIAKAAPEIKKPQVSQSTDLHGKPMTDAYVAEYTGEYSYDIQKSDSIVNPFTGTVSWKVAWSYNGQSTKTPTSFDATYVYRDGQWAMNSLRRRSGSDLLPAAEYVAFFLPSS